jgi:hypothetical protein
MQISWRSASRALGVALGLALCVYWLGFAFMSYPWIVPADHDHHLVRIYRNLSDGGLLMVAVSLASVFFAAGVVRTGRWSLVIATALVCMSAATVPLIYPSGLDHYLSPLRLPAHVGESVVIIVGIAVELCRDRKLKSSLQ